MNRTCKVALLLAAGAVGISLAASAQKQQPGAIAPPPRAELGPQRRRISLREALQLAAEQSPDVASARATAAIAEASVRRAWTAWQPDVTATGTFDHTNGISVVDFRPLVTALGHPELAADPRFAPTTIVAQNSRYATLQLNQPLLTPQGLFLPGVANSSAEAALRGFDEAREQVLLNVARNYLALQGLEGLLEAAREAERVALRREQDARARIAAGTDVEIALLRAQTETALARSQIASLQGQKDSTLPQLEALVGEAIEPQTARVEDFGPIAQESAQPWENTYSVKSAIASAVSAERSVRLAYFLWMPSVSGSFKENYNSNGGFAETNWSNDLIVNVSIPIYDQGLRYAQLAQDRARLSQAQALLASARAQARSRWLGARANLDAQQAVLQQSVAQEQLAIRTQVQ